MTVSMSGLGTGRRANCREGFAKRSLVDRWPVLMKHRSKLQPLTRQKPALETGLRAPELDELRRQGAKSAARGENLRANPMGDSSNMPHATGESSHFWQLRKEAWQFGHEAQSKVGNARLPDRKQLASLLGQIREAQETLSTLNEAIASARSEEGFMVLDATLRENERLQAELQEQSSRAAVEAGSAHAALQDAVHASETDSLTQLPNRTVLWDRLAHDLALAKRLGVPLAVLFLDLNELKHVNDRLGHGVGDLLLKHVASVLLAATRASDTVCRIGGDEFVILASHIPASDLGRLVQKISAAVAVPCMLDWHFVSPSVSIGTSSFPDDGDQPEVLVRTADMAMYEAKRARLARLSDQD